MTRPQLAQRDTIHLHDFDRKVVAIVTGSKPPHCKGPRLSGLSKNRFALACCCADCGDPMDYTDRYFIVQPLAVPAAARQVEVLHRGGTDLIHVLQLPSSDLPSSDARQVPSASALGISQDFSLEAAFKDALSKLKRQELSSPGLVEVVSMGALYGGFSGFSRLFVRVESTSFPLRNSKGKI